MARMMPPASIFTFVSMCTLGLAQIPSPCVNTSVSLATRGGCLMTALALSRVVVSVFAGGRAHPALVPSPVCGCPHFFDPSLAPSKAVLGLLRLLLI